MNKLFYIIFLFALFCLFSYLFIDPNFIYLKYLYSGLFASQRYIVAFLYTAFIGGLFLIYTALLRSIDKLNIKKLLIFLGCLGVLGIFAYPAALSFDLFNYIATAKVAFHYFENPYIIMPIEFIGDPLLLFTHAANKIALYGPVWILFTGLPFYLSFGNYLLSIILFKLFVFVFYFGIIFFIWKLTKNLYCVVYFAVSPLVLIETFVSGHNDVVMMFFALGSIYFLKQKKLWLAVLFIFLSILIKYATIFLLPLFAGYLWDIIRKKEVNYDKMYFYGFLLMLVIFFLSPIREEIYPWYAIWPLTFLSLLSNNKKYDLITKFFVFFTFCLMLRYIPFMLLGTYFGPTPGIKLVFTFIFPGIYLIYLFVRNKYKILS